MSTPAHSPRWSSLPWGLLGSLALIVVIEARLRQRADDFSRPESANWGYAANRSTRASKQAEILCFGTSLVKYGIQSREVERVTGKHTLNLAVFGGQMSSSYFLLKRAIESGARPQQLIVDCQDGPVPREHENERLEGVQSNLRWWPQILTLRDAVDLSWRTRDPGLFADVTLARMLTSYRARNEIRHAVVAGLQGTNGLSTEDIRTLRRNWAINAGTHVAPRKWNPDSKVEPAPTNSDVKFDDQQFARNKLTLIYAQKFVDLATEHGIPIFWLLPPIGPKAQQDRDRIGFDAYFTRQAHWIQSQSDLVTVIDGRRAGYDSTVFADTVHLDRAGGTTFSRDVAEIVKQSIENPGSLPRWIELPRYRMLTESTPLEDVAQSRLVVSKNGQIRR